MCYNDLKKGGVTVGEDALQMQNIINQTFSILEKYEEQLSSAEIRVAIYKRHIETEVPAHSSNRTGSIVDAIFNSVERSANLRAEEKNNYKNEKNKYDYLILSVVPREKMLLSPEDCREYSFLVKKTARPHLGAEPRHIVYGESQVLSKIEKRIQKIAKRASRQSPLKACKNTVLDALRYAYLERYDYKEHFCGRNRSFWESALTITMGVMTFLVVLIPWLIMKLF